MRYWTRSIDPLLLTETRVIPSLLLLTEAERCCLWMNSERCSGGLDEQFPVGVDEQDPVVLPLDEQDPDRSSRLVLDEQDPVEGRMNRTTPWRAG